MLETKLKLEEKPALVAEDVADAVLYVLGTPSHVQVSVKQFCSWRSNLKL